MSQNSPLPSVRESPRLATALTNGLIETLVDPRRQCHRFLVCQFVPRLLGIPPILCQRDTILIALHPQRIRITKGHGWMKRLAPHNLDLA